MPQTEPTSKPTPRRFRRALVALGPILAVLFLSARFGLVPLALNSGALRQALEEAAEQSIGCPVSVGKVRTHGVLGNRIGISEVRVRNPDGFSEADLIVAARILIAPSWVSLARREINLRSLDIGELAVRVERNRDGGFNVEKLASALSGAASQNVARRCRKSVRDVAAALRSTDCQSVGAADAAPRRVGNPSYDAPRSATASQRRPRSDRRPRLNGTAPSSATPQRVPRMANAPTDESRSLLLHPWVRLPSVGPSLSRVRTAAGISDASESARALLQANTTAEYRGIRITGIQAKVLDAKVVLAAPGETDVEIDRLSADASLAGPDGKLVWSLRRTGSEGPSINARGDVDLVRNGELLPLPPSCSVHAEVKGLAWSRLGTFALGHPLPTLPELRFSAEASYGSADNTITVARFNLVSEEPQGTLTVRGQGGFASGGPEIEADIICELPLRHLVPLLPLAEISLPKGSTLRGTFRTEQKLTLTGSTCRLTGTGRLEDAGANLMFIVPVTVGSADLTNRVTINLANGSISVEELKVEPTDASFPLSGSLRGTWHGSAVELETELALHVGKVFRQFAYWIRLFNSPLRLSGEALLRGSVSGPLRALSVKGQLDLTESGLSFGPLLRKQEGQQFTADLTGTIGADVAEAVFKGSIGTDGRFEGSSRSSPEGRAIVTKADFTFALPATSPGLPFPGTGKAKVAGVASIKGKLVLLDVPMDWPYLAASGTIRGGPGKITEVSSAPLLKAILRGPAVRVFGGSGLPPEVPFHRLQATFELNQGTFGIEELEFDAGDWADLEGGGELSARTGGLSFDLALKPEDGLLKDTPAEVRSAFDKLPKGLIPLRISGDLNWPEVGYALPAGPFRKLIEALGEEQGPPAMRP